MDWKEWAGIVGAITGTLSLALQIFSKRPRFYLSAATSHFGFNPDALLIIENPAPIALMVARVSAVPANRYKFKPVRHDPETIDVVRDTLAEMRTGRVPVLLKPNETRIIEIEPTATSGRALLIIWWHRSWLIPIALPKLIWLSPKRLDEIGHGSR